MHSEKQSKAIDLSHHLSDWSRSRTVSPLKGLQKYWGKPGLISLAGGLPSPAYFPFAAISADALAIDSFAAKNTTENSSPLSWLWNLFGASGKEKSIRVSIPKYSDDPNDINLETALQYSRAIGLPQLLDFVKAFSAKVFQPAYSDFAVLSHTGNTDAWNRCVATLCNPGEGVLTAAWTYPSAVATMAPYKVLPVPVDMDGEGMRSDSLREILSGWDAEARGMPRPHVMYTIPVGQNPCGSTMGGERKKEIYAICVEYDVIIVEDDPYYFLQEGEYKPKSERSQQTSVSSQGGEDAYISSLAPSYLKYDYEGRVIRLDTFSKTIAPGCRLGWFTCSPMFAERLERQGETSTQSPSGIAQAVVAKVITSWKYEGYIRWLQGLGTQYTLRRDHFIDCLADEFHLQRAPGGGQGVWGGSDIYIASQKPSRWNNLSEKYASASRKPMFSFVPPTSGMFLWIKLHLENHHAISSEPEETLEIKLFSQLAEAGVLFAPGFMFSAEQLTDSTQGHFRISFSNCETSEMKKAASIFAQVMTEFFKE
ncbi:hypothetical protein PLICRDRAFT_193623 [Plicaturopsis crispa FD-325 SS-3]|nr:hypothetical protein PLICRDRAFT_193623 [Plicaturopsis crispa FD-325 SS-3]